MIDQKLLITNYMIKGNGIGELVLVETGNWKLVYNPIDQRITNCLKAYITDYAVF